MCSNPAIGFAQRLAGHNWKEIWKNTHLSEQCCLRPAGSDPRVGDGLA